MNVALADARVVIVDEVVGEVDVSVSEPPAQAGSVTVPGVIAPAITPASIASAKFIIQELSFTGGNAAIRGMAVALLYKKIPVVPSEPACTALANVATMLIKFVAATRMDVVSGSVFSWLFKELTLSSIILSPILYLKH